MFCEKCGSPIQNCQKFCPNCGNQIIKMKNDSTYNTQQPISSYPSQTYATQQNLSMKWFKYLIYFSLFATAIENCYNAVMYFIGLRYGENSELMYKYFDELKTMDVIMGVVAIFMAIFNIYVRYQLADYCKNGPRLLLLMYVLSIACNILYYIKLASIVSESSPSRQWRQEFLASVDVSIIISVLGCVALIIANKIYFDKRKHLFVN